MKKPEGPLTMIVHIYPLVVEIYEGMVEQDPTRDPKELAAYVHQQIQHEFVYALKEMQESVPEWLNGTLERRRYLEKKLMARGLNPNGVVIAG